MLEPCCVGKITPVPNSDFIFDDKFQLITHKKQTSRFGRKEYFIAKQLILNIGKIVSRDLLIKELWGPINVSARTLDVYISKIRHKLNLTHEGGNNIESIYGYGYRLEKVSNKAGASHQ